MLGTANLDRRASPARLKLQGRYMGALRRRLPVCERVQVKRIRAEKGIRAAEGMAV